MTHKKERVLTEEQIEEVLTFLRKQMTEAKYFETDFTKGITTFQTAESHPYLEHRYNGTGTFTIRINGGAMDT